MPTRETVSLRIAIAADLHYGSHHKDGDLATQKLAAHLAAHRPDLLLLAGDIGADDHFGTCLELFSALDCPKALVPGNHDIWVLPDDDRGDSLVVYRELLPSISKRFSFHYLDHGPLFLPEASLTVVGSMNWYDYSWSVDRLQQIAPDWEERLRSKRFQRGQHNDANYVRWPYTDEAFTAEVVSEFERDLAMALERPGQVIAVTHHPPFRDLNPLPPAVRGLDDLLWEAFSGNSRMEVVMRRHADAIAFAFCGHTHQARQSEWAGIRGYNVGGGYRRKRLLWLTWPAGTVDALEFAAE